MKNQIDGKELVNDFILAYMVDGEAHEQTLNYGGGIEYKYLPILFRDIDRLFRDMGTQLLVVMPVKRISDDRYPVFVTQDMGNNTRFSFDEYFQKYRLKPVWKYGKVHKVVALYD